MGSVSMEGLPLSGKLDLPIMKYSMLSITM